MMQWVKRVLGIALAGLVLVSGGAASAESDRTSNATAESAATSLVETRQTTELTLADAVKAGQAAIAECTKDGHRVAVVVLSRAGVVQVALHGDGAGPQTDESAKRKAFTAVSMGRKTSELAGSAQGNGPTIRDIPGTLFLAGGVPVIANDVPIAGIGVGGAPSGDIDEKCASAGLAAIQ